MATIDLSLLFSLDWKARIRHVTSKGRVINKGECDHSSDPSFIDAFCIYSVIKVGVGNDLSSPYFFRQIFITIVM
jgi:hypothetical protein